MSPIRNKFVGSNATNGREEFGRFLNVDLDIESNSPLSAIARELGERVVVMYAGRRGRRFYLYLEGAGETETPDGTIEELCGLIEELSSDARRLWNGAIRREFNIGLEARFRLRRHWNQFTVGPRALRRITDLGASVAVTFYREDENDPKDIAAALQQFIGAKKNKGRRPPGRRTAR